MAETQLDDLIVWAAAKLPLAQPPQLFPAAVGFACQPLQGPRFMQPFRNPVPEAGKGIRTRPTPAKCSTCACRTSTHAACKAGDWLVRADSIRPSTAWRTVAPGQEASNGRTSRAVGA